MENFYDIIYGVHVEMDGRSGKHAGQKRTYRAVSLDKHSLVSLAFLFQVPTFTPSLLCHPSLLSTVFFTASSRCSGLLRVDVG